MLKRGNEIPTIDVVLVTISTGADGTEIALDTANKVAVSPQVETKDAIKLIVKERLIAQKPSKTIITGNTITLTDNVFNPEVAVILQGGRITYKEGSSGPITKYEPPTAGEKQGGTPFTMCLYSAVYDSAGLIVNYEKVTYPNCQGTPFGVGAEDGVFRISEYTINSAPKSNESPYTIEYIDELPEIS